MENTPQNIVTNPVPPTPKPKGKGLKVALIALLVLVAGGVGYVGYTNPSLFTAEITRVSVPSTVAAATMAIPNYTAGATDSGKIAVEAKGTATAEDMHSVQFRLRWSPASALSLNEDAIVFDADTEFKTADLKSVNTVAPGEAILSFFSNTPVSIGPNDKIFKISVQLNGTPGSELQLTADQVEVVVKDVTNPDLPFKVSTNFTGIEAGKITFTTQQNLRVLYAESTAVNGTQVVVHFSDLLKSPGAVGNFTITPAIAVTGVASGYLNGYDQRAVILTTATQNPGTLYTLTVAGLEGNTAGGIQAGYNKVIFEGFPSPQLSTVKLNSIGVNSSTSVTLVYSGALKPETVTPVNFKINSFVGGVLTPLTVTEKSIVNPTTVSLTTAQQTPDANYFVTVDKVADAPGNWLDNARALDFLGFSVPAVAVSRVNPNSVTNKADQDVAVIGQNLDTVDKAFLGEKEVQIIDKTNQALSLRIPLTGPEALPLGLYDLKLLNSVGATITVDNALTVNEFVEGMRIVSDQSRAIPARVAPDGKTKTKFWVLVEDRKGLNQISSVTIDLEQIGGNRAQEMTKDLGTQQQYRQFYVFETTVPATVSTKTEPYKLPVEVRKGTEVAQGTVEVTVTKDVLKSVPPTIDQVYANPTTVPPDGTTNVKISAKVSDPDGADSISSVVADLGSVGIGFVELKMIGEPGAANEKVTGFFVSDEFTVPKTTPEKDYTVVVTAEDDTGESSTKNLTLSVSSALTAPKFDLAKSYIGPRKSVPRDGKTAFAVHAMVTDPDGVSDIDSVTAYFGTTGIAPVGLTRDPSATESSKSALYNSPDIVVPPTTPTGVHDIEVVAVDKNGGRGNLILQVDVTTKDTVGDAPIIFSKKAYTNPKIAVNDGKTAITLYTFVRDDDGDLESVIVNLTGIGQVGPETPPDLGQVGAPPVTGDLGSGSCPAGSNTIVCMTPSFKEGNEGQWFVISGVTISTATEPSSQPYMAEVIATDAGGKISRGQIPISVSTSEGAVVSKTAPVVAAAVPVGPASVEVAFSKPMAALGISASGKDFTITERSNVSKKLTVLGAVIDASGMVVTLTTDAQAKGTEYVLTASTKLTDSSGIALSPGPKGQAAFVGFADSDKGPVVDFIGATDGETVEIDFQENIRPSSVSLGETALSNIKISEAEGASAPLTVKSVRLLDGKSIEVKTAQMSSGMRYRAEIKGVLSAAGIPVKGTITKFFKAINLRAVQKAAVASGADLNGDGKVDFIDFTMFSAVYGQSLGGGAAPADEGQGLSPIEPNPDSVVPHTSVP